MSDATIRALYELQRTAVIMAKLNPATSSAITDAVALAHQSRLCPIFDVESESDAFADGYTIGRDAVSKVLNFCAHSTKGGGTLTFYDIENHFSDGDLDRIAIVSILRYAFLRGKFTDKFYENLLSGSPAEASGITDKFGTDELALF